MMFRCFPVLLLLFLSSNAFAQSAADCAVLEEASDRLACYDKLFDNSGQPARQPNRRTPAPEAPREQTSQASTPSSTSPAPKPPTDEEVTSNEPDFGLTKPPVKDQKPELAQIDSRVDSITRRARDEMAFHLANDQTWAQTSARHVTIKVGDEVVVRKRRLGGYVLIDERGASTKVVRLR